MCRAIGSVPTLSIQHVQLRTDQIAGSCTRSGYLGLGRWNQRCVFATMTSFANRCIVRKPRKVIQDRLADPKFLSRVSDTSKPNAKRVHDLKED